MGIEQKLKIIGYAERRGKAACYDAFDVKARTLRRWRTALSGRGGDGLIIWKRSYWRQYKRY